MLSQRQLWRTVILAMIWIIFVSCAVTNITGMRDPSFQSNSYKKILIIAPFSDLDSRKEAEDIFVTKLSRLGLEARPSLPILFPGRNYSNEEFTKIILDSGADSILLLNLTDSYSKQTYMPDTLNSSGTITLQGNIAYFSSTTQHYGGHYISKPRVRYEIRLFDVQSGQAAWMATSLTRGNAYARFHTLIESLADAVVEQMRKDSLIP